MQRGTLTGILLGLLSSEKENTPTNTAIATAAGNKRWTITFDLWLS